MNLLQYPNLPIIGTVHFFISILNNCIKNVYFLLPMKCDQDDGPNKKYYRILILENENLVIKLTAGDI